MVSVCLPSDALLQHYHFTWVSLALRVGYLFTASNKARLLLLTFDKEYLLLPPFLTFSVG